MKVFYCVVALAVLLQSDAARAQSDNLCQNGEEFEAHPDCTLYYICDNGVPIVQECPPDLYWHSEINACDFPELVTDCSGGTRVPENPGTTPQGSTTEGNSTGPGWTTPEIEPTQYSTPIPGTTDSSGRWCPATGVVKVPHRTDCRKYFLCVEGVVIEEFICSEGLYFDPDLQECNFQDQVDCGADYTSDPPASTTTRPGEPQCTNDLELFPYPGDCSLYYRCFNSIPVVSFCPTGQHFDTSKLSCLPIADAQCTVRK